MDIPNEPLKFPKIEEKLVVISEEEYDTRYPPDQFILLQKLADGSRIYIKKSSEKVDLFWNKRWIISEGDNDDEDSSDETLSE